MGAGLLAYDLIYFNLAALLYGGAVLVGARAYGALSAHVPWWLAIFPAIVAAIVALIAEVSVLSFLCPRLRPGRYTMMKGAVFFGWIFRSMLRRILMVPGLRWIIFASNLLRWLALRGMGARVAFNSNMSADADILDPSLLTVGSGVTIGARCIVSGHYVEKGKLVLDEVRIGDGSLLALEVAVGPGTTIGKRVSVRARASVSVGVTIGDDALIGGETAIETGATIGAHAQIGTRVHVLPRSKVADHERLDVSASSSSTTSSAAPDV